jgi:SpoVK/Ycf46/Vps4 family AAA+-type ATPase
MNRDIRVEGLPDFIPHSAAESCKAKLTEAINELLNFTGLEDLNVIVGTPARGRPPKTSRTRTGSSVQGRYDDELSLLERAAQYVSRAPLYDFDFLVIPADVRETLLSAVDLMRLEQQVFERWNLRKIEPFPRTALNFYGPPGTGKTLAAHALASYVGRPILAASYAHIESKFLGDGPKNVEALFSAAERDNAVLFIDEADSLLSRRLTNVTQGSELAVNSMRSQLLVSLEHFHGVVIFSTNLIENYDRAFQTRMRHIRFSMPDREGRLQIWQRHLPAELPLGEEVNLEELASIEGVCGRDIKNAVIDAALRAARSDKDKIDREDLLQAVERIKQAGAALAGLGSPGAVADPSKAGR